MRNNTVRLMEVKGVRGLCLGCFCSQSQEVSEWSDVLNVLSEDRPYGMQLGISRRVVNVN